MMNAIEHGNLGIGHDAKSALAACGDFAREMDVRLRKDPWCHRTAQLTVKRDAGGIHITVADEGEGFDWHPYLAIDERRLTKPNGRGIAIANMLCFDDLRYNDRGNVVTALMRA